MIELTDAAVRLRPLDLGDVRTHLAGEDALTVRFLSGGRSTVESVTAWIERNAVSWQQLGLIRCFGIREVASDRLVGMVEANLAMPGVRTGVANIAYGVYAPYRGHGHATRAVRLMLQYLHAATSSDVALIQVEPENEASIQVALRSGFRFVGQRISADGDRLSMFLRPLHAP